MRAALLSQLELLGGEKFGLSDEFRRIGCSQFMLSNDLQAENDFRTATLDAKWIMLTH